MNEPINNLAAIERDISVRYLGEMHLQVINLQARVAAQSHQIQALLHEKSEQDAAGAKTEEQLP